MTAPCTDCDQPADDFVAVTADDEDQVDENVDPRGTKVRVFGPMLIAPYGKKTGDRRRFAAQSLTNRDTPLAVKWQRADEKGHSTSVVVAAIDEIEHRDDGVYGSGIIFDPDPDQLPRLAEDVAEFNLLASQGVLGPSVDLDAMEFRALPPEGDEHAGELAAGEERPEIEVTSGRISAVTAVVIPAFAEVDRFAIREEDAGEYAARKEAAYSALTAAVRATGWTDMPLAAPGTAWDAEAAQQRIKSWAGGDMGKYAQAFLWSGEPAQNLTSYKFPLADVIGGQLKLVPKAVTAASGVLAGAMGGTSLPMADQARMHGVLVALKSRFDPDQDGDDDRDDLSENGEGAHGLDATTFTALVDELGPELDGEAATFGARFDAIVAKLRGRKGIADPAAVAASIGRAKYGKKGMARLRAGVSPSKVKPLAASGRLTALIAAAVTGDWAGVEEDDVRELASLTASGYVPAAVDSTWFDNPKLDRPTPLRITEDGRVFGHVADWKTCHTAFAGCVRAPKSKSNYAYFHVGETLTDKGPLAVGKLTIGGGHADGQFGYRAAAAHYDDVATAVAEVRAGEDKHGIWVAGRLLPGVQGTEREAELRRSPLSGDWRPIGGHLEMIAALGVNSPGFPIPRVALAASGAVDPEAEGQVVSLVAAGVLAPARPAMTFDLEQVQTVARAAAQAVLDEQAAAGRRAKAQGLFAVMDDTDDQQNLVMRRRKAKKAAMAVSSGAKAVGARSAGGDYQGG